MDHGYHNSMDGPNTPSMLLFVVFVSQLLADRIGDVSVMYFLVKFVFINKVVIHWRA